MISTRASNGEAAALNTGILILRLGVGLSILLFFGRTKLHDAWAYLHTGQWPFIDFNRKVGLPLPILVAFVQTLNESLGAFIVACGFLTRYAAASVGLGFVAATICSLKMGEPAWLTAAYFALMFITLAFTGPGNFSLDHLLKFHRSRRFTQQSSRSEEGRSHP